MYAMTAARLFVLQWSAVGAQFSGHRCRRHHLRSSCSSADKPSQQGSEKRKYSHRCHRCTQMTAARSFFLVRFGCWWAHHSVVHDVPRMSSRKAGAARAAGPRLSGIAKMTMSALHWRDAVRRTADNRRGKDLKCEISSSVQRLRDRFARTRSIHTGTVHSANACHRRSTCLVSRTFSTPCAFPPRCSCSSSEAPSTRRMSR